MSFGYAKGYKYLGDGTLTIRVRVPSIHGAYTQQAYKGTTPNNYVLDKDLPYYRSVLLPVLPNEGDVVLLISDTDSADFIVIGVTGGTYQPTKLT
jgi:hypothetical protein